jgi:hypothetical protein
MTLKALNVAFLYCYAESQYVQCLYAECGYGMWISTNSTKFRFLKITWESKESYETAAGTVSVFFIFNEMNLNCLTVL